MDIGGSILQSVKKMLGIDPSYTPFDAELIIFINAALMILRQIGVGPEEGFSISDEYAEWTEISSDISLLEAVKPYVFMKVKMMFDPPQSGTANAYNAMIPELEWRIYVEAERIKKQLGGANE